MTEQPNQPYQPYQPYQPPQAYPPPPFPPSGYPAAAASSGRATASLVLGIVSLLCFGFLAGIPAVVLGVLAHREIKESGGRVSGGGLATAGIVTGAIGTVWSLVAVAILVIAFFVGAGSSSVCTSDGGGTRCSQSVHVVAVR